MNTPASPPIQPPARTMWSCLIITLILASIPFLNIAAFIVIATCLGGDALNGHVKDGHYFFTAHGKDTEVSRAVFNYSRIHAYTVMGSIGLFLLALLSLPLLKLLTYILHQRLRYRRR